MLGAHVELATRQALEWLRRARPRVVKWLDFSESGVAALRAMYVEWRPVVVGRVERVDRLTPLEAAEVLEEHARRLPEVTYWEGRNEPGSSAEELRLANAWYLSLAARFAGRLLVGCLSEGAPANPADFALLAPAIRLAAQKGGGIATHEYDAPRLQTSVGWRVGRVRKLWEQLPSDLRGVPWLITEFGIDFGVNHEGEGLSEEDAARYVRTPMQGWRGRLSEEEYVSELAWAADFYRRLAGERPGVTGPNLVGATIYTCGCYDSWRTFDVSESARIADAVAQLGQAGASPAPAQFPPKPGPTERAMLRVAILPSNQDTNVFKTASGFQMSERAQCMGFADWLRIALRKHPQVEAEVFVGAPESLDKSLLEGLRRQQLEAKAWLDSAPAGTLTVALNVHTDAGKASHVGYYFDGVAGDITRRLGSSLAAVANRYFPGSILSGDYRDYVFATAMGHRHCPVLLELGSHEVSANVETLSFKGQELARDLAAELARFFGLGEAMDWQALGEYARWSLARIANREDPRDGAAFRKHLEALGKPRPVDLRAHGFPT